MTSLQAEALQLTPREVAIQNAGFEIRPSGSQVCFVLVTRLTQVEPFLRQRLKKMGAGPADEVIASFSENMDVVCVMVQGRGISFEETASTPAGVAILEGLGVQF